MLFRSENKNIIRSVSTKGTFITSKIEEIVQNKIRASIELMQKEVHELKMLGLSFEDIVERIK